MSLSGVAVKTAAAGIRRSSAIVLIGLAVVGLAGCDIDWLDVFDPDDDETATSDTTAPVADTDIPGLNLAVSDTGFTTTANALANGIDNRAPFRSLSVNFQASADDSGPDIRPTRAIFYYNAPLMAPLIAADPRAGLDLPPAVLVYQTDASDTTLTGTTDNTSSTADDGSADVGVGYNAADYLAARYDLDEAGDTLDAYEDDLARLAADAAGNSVSVTGATDGITEGEGITRQTSDRSFSDTVDNLQQAIDDRDDVSLLGQFDHAAAAQAAGTMLTANNDPAILYVIDATDVISRLIAGGQTVAVDLPIRILVSQNANGRVSVYHDTAAYLVARHDLDDVDDAVDTLDALLDDLVEQATQG